MAAEKARAETEKARSEGEKAKREAEDGTRSQNVSTDEDVVMDFTEDITPITLEMEGVEGGGLEAR